MDKKTSNFSVGSKGYCFLCLNNISTRFHSTVTGNDAVYSLHDVAQYLKVDMRKAFIAGGPIPAHLLAKVKRSRLKVELCESCGSITKNISKRCQQLEKLKLEVESGLESILEKMTEANKTGRIKQFREAVGSERGLGLGGGMEIMEALRLETMQKCSQRINKASPRLLVQKVTSEEIQRRTQRIPKIDVKTSGSGLQQTRITVEESENSIQNWTLEDDFHSENSFVDEMNHTEDSILPIVKTEGGTRLASVKIGEAKRKAEMALVNNSKLKLAVNPETGKYSCQLCSMEYTTGPGLYYHHNSVHRRVRFRCKICSKEFKRESFYKIHHQSVHMGIRFQCQVCKKMFTQKGYLMTHQRKAGCAIKLEQNK